MTDPSSSADVLEPLADEAWQGSLAADPLYATTLGDRRFLTRLRANDPGASDRERTRLESLIARTRAVDPEALDPSARVTRSALLDLLAHESGIAQGGLERWTIDPLDGPQVALLNVESYQPIETEAEGRAAVARWREMGPFIDRHVEGLRSGAGDGLVAPRSLVEKVIGELDDLLARSTEDWPLLRPASIEHPTWTARAQADFRRDLESACRETIRPAFERQRRALIEEILPLARPNERPGLCHVPGGEAAYAHLVRAHTTLDLEQDAIHRTGLEEIARIDAAFAELGGRVLGTASTGATLDRLRHDPALRFATSDEVAATARAALARANAAIGDWFGRLPATPCEVAIMGEHESRHSTIAYYRQPAADGSRPGRYYLNTTMPETRPRYEAECLAFHEAVPGHHLQIAIAQELDDLPPFRRFGGPTAYVEGWGLYTERLSDEMGLYSGDLDRFGILSFDAWRACRLVVDTGMHALGWTRDRAIAFMVGHTALAENNIVNEVDRYIAMPAQALAYKIGQLELLRLQAMAREALGDQFDIRAFHDAVLSQGAVGLETLGGVIEAWVESNRPG